uniref:Dipeptidylpeptidase IV N-terminal domain-containing protein n=1 Tax=Parascaris univalens TaxID=6257 RepID=A0A915C5K5_PARUN
MEFPMRVPSAQLQKFIVTAISFKITLASKWLLNFLDWS